MSHGFNDQKSRDFTSKMGSDVFETGVFVPTNFNGNCLLFQQIFMGFNQGAEYIHPQDDMR